MAVINSKKLLPSGKPGGAISEAQKSFLVPVSNITYKKEINISQKLLKPADQVDEGKGGSLVVVKKKVLTIRNIINSTYLIEKSEINRKRKERERQKFETREKKLEEKPSEKVDPNKVSQFSLPGRSILDTINRFLAFTLAGYLFNKYNEYLPKLLEFGKFIKPFLSFAGAFSKNVVDGVIKFIDLGYKAYDGTRDFVKQFGGEGAAKTFDEFSKQLNLLLNGAIGIGMLVASTSPKGGTGALAGATTAATRSATKSLTGFGAGTAMSPGRYRLPGQAKVSSFAVEQARKGVTLTEQVAAQKAAKQAATQGVKQSAKFAITKAPIIGALIGFIIDTVIFKEKPTRAAAGAVGNALGSAIGAGLAGGGTFGLGAGIGLFVGGFVGDWLGKSLYDVITGYNQEPIKGKAGGGQITSRGQSGVTPTRRISTKRAKTPRQYTPQKTQPGRDIGGKFRIENLYGRDEPGTRSALRALTKSSDDLKKMKSMNRVAGGMLGAGIDMALGQKPDKKLASSLGSMFGSVVEAAVNSELNSSFNDISKTIAMANGGVVPSREISSGISIGEKIGNYISNAFSVALESSASRVLQNLNQELNLEGGPFGGAAPGGGGDDLPSSDIPGLQNITPGSVPSLERFKSVLKGTPMESEAEAIYNVALKEGLNPAFVAGLAGAESTFGQYGIARGTKNPYGLLGRTFSSYEDATRYLARNLRNPNGPYAGKRTLRDVMYIYTPPGHGGNNTPRHISNIISIGGRSGGDASVLFIPRNFDPLRGPAPAGSSMIPELKQQQQNRPPENVPGNLKDTGIRDSSGRPIKFKGIIANAFIDMAAEARKNGINLSSGISSSYRSRQDQIRVYREKYGANWRNHMVWNSRHMSGEAFDINWNSAAGIWIRNNARRFGFQYNTYSGESTHFDWVGGYRPRSQASPSTPSSTPQSGTRYTFGGMTVFKGTDGKYYEIGINGTPIETDKRNWDDIKNKGTRASIGPSASREIASLQETPQYDKYLEFTYAIQPYMVG